MIGLGAARTAIAAVAVLALGTGLFVSSAASQTQSTPPFSIDWSLVRTAKPLERHALISVRDSQGQPVVGARIEVSVDMPSMPMMHKVPMVVAEPTAESGSYLARFTLEMPGEWAAQIEMIEPRRAKTVKRFQVD
jgi:hypothetical protein